MVTNFPITHRKKEQGVVSYWQFLLPTSAMYDHISGQRKSQVQSEEESKRIKEKDMVTLEAYGELNGKSKSML